MKKPLIVIAGPTACGKTDSSILLAKKINGEIISGDSMQVYKYMDIGTAKVTKEEADGVPHYLVDEIFPDEEYNAMIFQKKAKEYIEEIYKKGKVPIIVGGTGFYINALVYDNDFEATNEASLNVRKELEEECDKFGKEYVYNKLKEVDYEYAKNIHFNNSKRVIRALEFFITTGNKLSEHNKNAKEKESPYDLKFFLLNMDREKLYNRINMRVDLMVEKGVVNEVENILKMGYDENLVSMQAIGYKEFLPYIKGEASLEECVEFLKQRTRNFAKRQLTWFRQQKNICEIDLTNKSKEEVVEEMIKNI